MRNAISGSFRQISTILMFLVPLLTSMVIMIEFVDPVIRSYHENSNFVKGFHFEYLAKGFQSDQLSSFLPFLAALPFASCFIDDLKSKFVRSLLIRSNYCTYLASRIVAGFLAGGLTILSGALIAWGTAAIVLVPLEREIKDMEFITIDGLIEICFLLFLNGGLWAVLGMTMSTVMESKYIAYCSPFIVYYLLVILYERYFPNAWLLYPKNWLDPEIWPYGIGGAALFLLELTFLCSLVFYVRGKRRLQQL